MSAYTEDAIFARYTELVAKRDAAYAKVAPLKEKLETVNALADKYRSESVDLAKQVSDALGGHDWIVLKKEISTLARFLSKPNGTLATK